MCILYIYNVHAYHASYTQKRMILMSDLHTYICYVSTQTVPQAVSNQGPTIPNGYPVDCSKRRATKQHGTPYTKKRILNGTLRELPKYKPCFLRLPASRHRTPAPSPMTKPSRASGAFGDLGFRVWGLSWTPKVCRTTAFYEYWANILPTLPTTEPEHPQNSLKPRPRSQLKPLHSYIPTPKLDTNKISRSCLSEPGPQPSPPQTPNPTYNLKRVIAL